MKKIIKSSFFLMILPVLYIVSVSISTDFVYPGSKLTPYVGISDTYNCNSTYYNDYYIMRFYTFHYKKTFLICLPVLLKELEAGRKTNLLISKKTIDKIGLSVREKDIDLKLWRFIYNRLSYNSRKITKRLSDIFSKIIKQNNFNKKDTVSLVLAFVRSMKYKRPYGALDLNSPIETLALKGKGSNCMPSRHDKNGWNGEGDCDSKSLLLALILKHLGIKSVLLYSSLYAHTAAGINIEASAGSYVLYKGLKYYFADTTIRNGGVGKVVPRFENLSAFNVIEISQSYKNLLFF